MPITNYSELQDAIAEWLNRDDLTAAIPSFIALTEADLNTDVKHYRRETRLVVDLDAQFIDLPADFRGIKRLTVDGTVDRPLAVLTGDVMASYRADIGNRIGTPTHYSLTGGQLELCPTPGSPMTGVLVYHTAIPALTDLAPTNWLLAEQPGAYLYGALLQAAPYLKDDPRIMIWKGLYGEAINRLTVASEQAEFSGPLRIRTR